MLLLLYFIALRRIGTPAKERYYNLNSNYYHMTGKIQHVQVGEYFKKGEMLLKVQCLSSTLHFNKHCIYSKWKKL